MNLNIPCFCFNHISLFSLNLFFHSDWETRTDLSVTLSSSQNFDMKSHLGDIAHVDVVNSETAYYAHVLLDWVRRWDVDTRNRILLDPVMCKKGERLCGILDINLILSKIC